MIDNVNLAKSIDTLISTVENTPREWQQVIALRVAQRVLPLITADTNKYFISNETEAVLYLAAFRAAHTAWASHRYSISGLSLVPYVKAAELWLDEAIGTTPAYQDSMAGTAAYALAGGAMSLTEASSYRSAISDAAQAAFNVDLDARQEGAASAILNSVNEDKRWIEQKGVGLDSKQQARSIVGQRLWLGASPRWAMVHFNRLINRWRMHDENASVWANWYIARIDGKPSFGLPDNSSQKLDIRVASGLHTWWIRSPSLVNAVISDWVDEAKARIGKPLSISMHATDFIVQYLSELRLPATTNEIRMALKRKDILIKDTSLNWTLTNLNSSGRIRRVRRGMYESNPDFFKLPVDKLPSISVIPAQSPLAVSFSSPAGGPLTPNADSTVQKDPEQAALYQELRKQLETTLSEIPTQELGACRI